MFDVSPLVLGVGLGLRHAADADHVAAVSTLLQAEASLWKATRLALLWGAGHSVSFLGVGGAVILAGLHVPAGFEHAAELVIALMLIVLGLPQLRRRVREVSRPVSSARPIAIGIAHGLAGSAGVALLALATIPSRHLAVLYLAMFALGTLAGMALLTTALAGPLSWSGRGQGKTAIVMQRLPGALSVLVGGAICLDVLAEVR